MAVKILDFTDLIKWWKENCNKDDKRYVNSLYHACYDNFFQGGKFHLKRNLRLYKDGSTHNQVSKKYRVAVPD
jgi:hypothetical protein